MCAWGLFGGLPTQDALSFFPLRAGTHFDQPLEDDGRIDTAIANQLAACLRAHNALLQSSSSAARQPGTAATRLLPPSMRSGDDGRARAPLTAEEFLTEVKGKVDAQQPLQLNVEFATAKRVSTLAHLDPANESKIVEMVAGMDRICANIIAKFTGLIGPEIEKTLVAFVGYVACVCTATSLVWGYGLLPSHDTFSLSGSDFLTNVNISRLPDMETLVPELAPLLKSLFSVTGVLHLEMCYVGRILHKFMFDGDDVVPALRQLLLIAGAPPSHPLEPKKDLEFIRPLLTKITSCAPCVFILFHSHTLVPS